MKGVECALQSLEPGYKGLASAVGLAEPGPDVVLDERDPDRFGPGHAPQSPSRAEVLRQASALEGSRRPAWVVIGTFSEHVDPDALAKLGRPLLVMWAEDASLVKSAPKVFLATR